MEIEWKNSFIEKYSELTDIEKFKEFSLRPLRRSIRVNTLKISIEELKKRLEKKWELRQIPWSKEGFWIEGGRVDAGNSIEHMLGYFYIQEAASMIPPLALNPLENDIILDSCAAPGSKTSQLAALMNNKGLIIANDVTYMRLKPLTINLQRCGVLNTVQTVHDARLFKKYKFDKILLDAPCSGTGAIRKSLKTIKIWNPKFCSRMAKIQSKMLEAAFTGLKEGGSLVYSTCTLEPEEDEIVIQKFIEKNENAKVEKINLPIKTQSLKKYKDVVFDKSIKNTIRIWPQDYDTEGFFVAKIFKD